MADKYIDATQMLIDESEAYMNAQLKVDDVTRKINEIVHIKLQQLLIDAQEEDVVEVVRCKDCKYYYEGHYENNGEPPYIKHTCTVFHRQIKLDDYCSYGERK